MTDTKILFYDTETTGLVAWHEPSGAGCQPHLVQLAALVVDEDTHKVEQSMDVIVSADGWDIPEEVTAIHGITTEHARKVGIPEATAANVLFDLWAGCDLRVGHNQSFDMRILRIAAKRYRNDEFADHWKAGASVCTGLLAKPIMQMEPKGRYGYKMPKLVEAYEHFFGVPLKGAHSAMTDTRACMDVYFAIKDLLEAV